MFVTWSYLGSKYKSQCYSLPLQVWKSTAAKSLWARQNDVQQVLVHVSVCGSCYWRWSSLNRVYVLHDPQTEDVQQVLVHVCLCFIDLHSMTAEKHIPSSLYTQNTSHLPNSAFHNSESIGSVRGFRARSRVNWFSSGFRARYTTHTTHTLSHHSPLCKSYSQISSFGRKTSRSATDCRETHSFITLHTKHLTSARRSTAFKISETSPKQTFAIIWIPVIYSCVMKRFEWQLSETMSRGKIVCVSSWKQSVFERY